MKTTVEVPIENSLIIYKIIYFEMWIIICEVLLWIWQRWYYGYWWLVQAEGGIKLLQVIGFLYGQTNFAADFYSKQKKE